MGNDNVINKPPQQDSGYPGQDDGSGNSSNLLSDRSFREKILANKALVRTFRTIAIILATVIFIFASIIFIIFGVPRLSEMASGHKTQITYDKDLRQSPAYKKQVTQITKDIQRLSRKYSAFTSGQSYIVINTTDNRFFLYQSKKLIREGFCSSGSYTMLQTTGNKKWVFKTPKGKYWIQGKTTNPVWKKPDWAFVEEGLPIPPRDDFSRYEYGVLGDYALAIGDGYLIHGTIYKRFLGMPVTHGCVRLNDEDLEVIYKTLNIGSKVYIF
jgi:lipoprotein-anchoring transpeptidase ErfK/SrfK